jgi:hypothetical protein
MGKLGISVEDPEWLEVRVKATKDDYIKKINESVTKTKFDVVMVVIGDKKIKANIKAALDKLGVIS